MESVFHDYYYRIQPEVTISDLATLKQSEDEPAQDFITRFRKLKMKMPDPYGRKTLHPDGSNLPQNIAKEKI